MINSIHFRKVIILIHPIFPLVIYLQCIVSATVSLTSGIENLSRKLTSHLPRIGALIRANFDLVSSDSSLEEVECTMQGKMVTYSIYPCREAKIAVSSHRF